MSICMTTRKVGLTLWARTQLGTGSSYNWWASKSYRLHHHPPLHTWSLGNSVGEQTSFCKIFSDDGFTGDEGVSGGSEWHGLVEGSEGTGGLYVGLVTGFRNGYCLLDEPKHGATSRLHHLPRTNQISHFLSEPSKIYYWLLKHHT